MLYRQIIQNAFDRPDFGGLKAPLDVGATGPVGEELSL